MVTYVDKGSLNLYPYDERINICYCMKFTIKDHKIYYSYNLFWILGHPQTLIRHPWTLIINQSRDEHSILKWQKTMRYTNVKLNKWHVQKCYM